MKRARAVALHFHAGGGAAAARRREHALALDLDHARPAIAVGAHAGLVAKARNGHAQPIGDLDQRLAGERRDFGAVQLERDQLLLEAAFERSVHPASSCGKYLTTHAIGLGAAWPSPQIDASVIACDSSCSSDWFQRGLTHQHDGLFGAHAAWRALPARFVGEELHHVKRGVARAIVLRKDDDRGRADEATVRLQRVEIERDIAERCRQDTAGRATGQVTVEFVAVLHAAAILIDELAHRDARRREMDAGLGHASGHRERAQPLAAVATLSGEPRGALLQDLAHPIQRFHVVLERGPPEQADLRDVRRAQPRHPALALDRFDHRRLFAADVGAGAATQMNARQRARRIALERGDLVGQQRTARRVFVAQIDVDLVDADGPRRDQHAFEEAMRVALEIVAILERAGLAFVDVDGHEARRRLGAHDLPFASRQENPRRPGRAAPNFPFRRRPIRRSAARDAIAQDFVAAACRYAARSMYGADVAARHGPRRSHRRSCRRWPRRSDCVRRPPRARARSVRCRARR